MIVSADLHHRPAATARRRLGGAATACLSLALILAVGRAARAQFDVETKLTAADATAGDFFGYSVGISGSTVIVGARGDDGAGSNSGSAYLFDVTTGEQLFKLIASDAAAGDRFGASVAISGNLAIVGAFRDDAALSGEGIDSGSAYLFDVTTGEQLFKLTAADRTDFDEFGFSVGISGNTAIVGARRSGELTPSGAAYLFDVSSGIQIAKLSAAGDVGSAQFGHSVAISGNTAIAGAPDDVTGLRSGSAYLFDADPRSPGFGNQRLRLTASDARSGDNFGYSVAIDGGRVLVGARDDDDAGRESGSAYLFDTATGEQLFKLTASDAAAGDLFGYSVAISGGRALIGARDDDDAGKDSGAAYLFDVTTGKQLFKLTAPDAALDDRFARSVAISGGRVLVGARDDDDDGSGSGSAHIFTTAAAFSDLTGNGFVDFEDFTILLANWNKNVGPELGNLVDADITPVNFADMTVMLADWTGPGPADSPQAVLGEAAVPEPSSFLLMVTAMLAVCIFRRRRCLMDR